MRDEIVVQKISSTTAVWPTATIAQADGHKFKNSGVTFVILQNISTTTPRSVTFPTPNKVFGLDIADMTVSIPANSYRVIGPFSVQAYNYYTETEYGMMHVDTVSPYTDILIRVFKF